MSFNNVIPGWLAREMMEDDKTKPRAVCVLITRDTVDGPEILAVSRRDDENAYGLPGGKVDLGEGRMAAATRELREETGIVSYHLDPVFTCLCEGDVDYITTTFKAGSYQGTPETRDGEGRVAWVTPQRLIEGPFGDYNRKLFKAVGIKIRE